MAIASKDLYRGAFRLSSLATLMYENNESEEAITAIRRRLLKLLDEFSAADFPDGEASANCESVREHCKGCSGFGRSGGRCNPSSVFSRNAALCCLLVFVVMLVLLSC